MTPPQCYASARGTRAARLAALATAVLVAGGCAGVRLEAPTVTVAGVVVDRLTPTDARFGVLVTMANPNDRAIVVEAIDARLRIEDVVIGTAELADAVHLPARGEATARLVARGDLASSLRAAAQVASRAQSAGEAFRGIRYAVEGSATIDGGSVYPFSRSGEIAWNPRAQ